MLSVSPLVTLMTTSAVGSESSLDGIGVGRAVLGDRHRRSLDTITPAVSSSVTVTATEFAVTPL